MASHADFAEHKVPATHIAVAGTVAVHMELAGIADETTPKTCHILDIAENHPVYCCHISDKKPYRFPPKMNIL